jgi:hypothetical protein
VYLSYRPQTDVTLDQTLYNDYILDGGEYNYQSSFTYVDVSKLPFSIYRIKTISAFVLHVDEPYYRYHRSMADQLKAQNNPFFDPILIYTNFKGGAGVFAAYNMAQKTLPFQY